MKTSFVHPVCSFEEREHNVKHEQKQKWECWRKKIFTELKIKFILSLSPHTTDERPFTRRSSSVHRYERFIQHILRYLHWIWTALLYCMCRRAAAVFAVVFFLFCPLCAQWEMWASSRKFEAYLSRHDDVYPSSSGDISRFTQTQISSVESWECSELFQCRHVKSSTPKQKKLKNFSCYR